MTPKKKTGLDMIKKNMWLIGLIFAVGGWVTWVELSQASGREKNKSQDEKLDKITEVLKSNNQLIQKMDNRMSNLESNFELILEVVGIKVNDSLKNYWKSLPRTMPLDAFGNPVIGGEWMDFSHKYLLATRYRYINEDSTEYRVEWDKRPALESP